MVDPETTRVGEFLEATAGAPVEQGVYRVVGTSGDALVLLRVSENGRRAHTGVVEHVDVSAVPGSFEATTEPWPTARGVLTNLVQGPYWMVRSIR